MNAFQTDARLDAVLAAEQQRQALVVTRDFDALAGLLADDLVYVHSMGTVHDKAAYLAHAQGPVKVSAIARGPLAVRFVGDVALMSGTQTNTFQPPENAPSVTVDSFATQVWVFRDGRWQLLAFQATRATPA